MHINRRMFLNKIMLIRLERAIKRKNCSSNRRNRSNFGCGIADKKKNVAGRSYKKDRKIYVKASLSGDAEELIDLMPEEMIDKTFEEEGFFK